MNDIERRIGQALTAGGDVVAVAIFQVFARSLKEHRDPVAAWRMAMHAAARLTGDAKSLPSVSAIMRGDDEAAQRVIASIIDAGLTPLGGSMVEIDYVEAVAMAIRHMRRFQSDLAAPPAKPPTLRQAMALPPPNDADTERKDT